MVIPGGDQFAGQSPTYGNKIILVMLKFMLPDLKAQIFIWKLRLPKGPGLANFNFKGIKKTEAEELNAKGWPGKRPNCYRK